MDRYHVRKKRIIQARCKARKYEGEDKASTGKGADRERRKGKKKIIRMQLKICK